MLLKHWKHTEIYRIEGGQRGARWAGPGGLRLHTPADTNNLAAKAPMSASPHLRGSFKGAVLNDRLCVGGSHMTFQPHLPVPIIEQRTTVAVAISLIIPRKRERERKGRREREREI